MDPLLVDGMVNTGIKLGSLVYTFSFIGASLKYIDQVHDEGIFNETFSWALAVVAGLLMGVTIAYDPHAAVILLAIIIGVGITSKLDNTAHRLVALLAFGIPAFLALAPPTGYTLSINWLPLALLVGAGVLDEYLDDVGDEQNIWILTTRPSLKLAVLGLVVFNVFEWVYFAALMSFDISYMLVSWYSHAEIIQKTSLGKLNEKRSLLWSTPLL